MSSWAAINHGRNTSSPLKAKRARNVSDDAIDSSQNSQSPSSILKKKRSDEPRETEEALEARLTKSYENALRSHNDPEVAISTYVDLLDLVNSLGNDLSITTRKIMYLCYKNVANLEANLNEPMLVEALNHYAEALMIDNTDFIVWYEAGSLSYKLGRFSLARELFEKAMNMDSTFWPLVHKLAQTLFVLKDDEECVRIIRYILSTDPSHTLATQLLGFLQSTDKHQVFKEDSAAYRLLDRRISMKYSVESEPARKLVIEFNENSWSALGELLLDIYNRTTENQIDLPYCTSLTHALIKILHRPSSDKEAPSQNVEEVVTMEDVKMEVDSGDGNGGIHTKEGVPSENAKCEDLGGLEDVNTISQPEEWTEQSEKNDTESTSPTIMNRRISNRTIKRLQEEQEAAIQFAKEKDVSYRLMNFMNIDENSSYECFFESPFTSCIAKNTLVISYLDEKFEIPLHKNAVCDDVQEPTFDSKGTNSCIDMTMFLRQHGSGKSTIESLMINYIEICARHFQYNLEPHVIFVAMWMKKCIYQDLSSALPISASPSKLSLSARMFLLEIEVDVLILNFDPLRDSRLEYTSELEKRLYEIQLLILEDDVVFLMPRLLWLQIHINEQLDNISLTTSQLNEIKLHLDQDIYLGNITKFPIISKGSVDRKISQLQLAFITQESREMMASTDGNVHSKVIDLVLPHYDPAQGNAVNIENLIIDFRIFLLRRKEANGIEENQMNTPLFTILLKCLGHQETWSKSYEILILGLYYVMHPSDQVFKLDSSCIQCIKYIITRLIALAGQEFKKELSYSKLLDYCCFKLRDIILQESRLLKYLEHLPKLLSPHHSVNFVGKILEVVCKLDLRSKSSHDHIGVLFSALEHINRYFTKLVDSDVIEINGDIPKALSISIINVLKQQLNIPKHKSTTRNLMYTTCTAYTLVWYTIHKTNVISCGEMIQLIHDIMVSGDGLAGYGVCGMEKEGYNFLKIAREILKKSNENVEEEIAQIYHCLYGYGLLSTCENHHGDMERKRIKTKESLMEMFEFCQKTENKLARKECSALFVQVLELPDTKDVLKSLILVDDMHQTLAEYLNPSPSDEIHSINPIQYLRRNEQPENAVSGLWYELASNFHLPKIKRRGREYSQLLSFEVQTFQLVQYLQNDIILHPGRGESYRQLAACLKTLRCLIVDHWEVVWTNYCYPNPPDTQTVSATLNFETLKTTPFFQELVKWIQLVQKSTDDEPNNQNLIDESRKLAQYYTNYVAVLAELQFRSLDMAAKYDPTHAGESYEDAGTLAWNLALERCPNGQAYCYLASHYFKLSLLQENVDDEGKFRIHYMLGKVYKKMIPKEGIHLEKWKAVLDYFHIGEVHRVQGDLESLPHSFYQLHSCRLKLLLDCVNKNDQKDEKENLEPNIQILKLLNNYFYIKKQNKQKNDLISNENEWTKEKIDELLDEKGTWWSARELLLGNCLDALESIPSDDRYFHPAYYTFSWGLKYGQAIIDTTNELWREKCSIQSAIRAIKPLFDRKRPQVVAIWLSESETHKLEELHQNQAKYDRLRLKYFDYNIQLLIRSGDYQRISDLTGWVISSKEEHWVIDSMLLQCLKASCYLSRGKLLDLIIKCSNHDELNIQQKVLNHLNRMYSLYLEYNEIWHRIHIPNSETIGNWIWEVAMSYALYHVVNDNNDIWCIRAIGHVEKMINTFSHSISSDLTEIQLLNELKMENESYWPTLVDESLNYCSFKWPEKNKSKGKPYIPRSKLRFLNNS